MAGVGKIGIILILVVFQEKITLGFAYIFTDF
jgi:hypothetical protein